MKLSELENFVILGFLKEKPLHGYEIKKKITRNFGYFIGFTPQFIYYALKKLEKEKFLTKRKEKIGSRPERETYQITKKGENEFDRLMEKNLDEFFRPLFNIDLAIYFLKYIEISKFKEKILKGERKLREIRVWAKKEERKKIFPYSLICKHIEKAISAEIEFLEEVKKSI